MYVCNLFQNDHDQLQITTEPLPHDCTCRSQEWQKCYVANPNPSPEANKHRQILRRLREVFGSRRAVRGYMGREMTASVGVAFTGIVSVLSVHLSNAIRVYRPDTTVTAGQNVQNLLKAPCWAHTSHVWLQNQSLLYINISYWLFHIRQSLMNRKLLLNNVLFSLYE